MGKKASLNEVQRAQIVILHKEGLSERLIIQKLVCSKTAVHQAIVKFKNGTAGLFFLPKGTTMNGARYLELLKDKLKLHMTVYRCTTFMQDGAPCNRSKVVSDYLKKIKTIDWPGNSPDLNPVENLGSLLKDRVVDRQPTSTQDLESVIKHVWIHEITEYCKSLVESMPRCLQAVLENTGGHTKD